MVSTIGLIILLLGIAGAALMLYLAVKSAESVSHVKCQKCGQVAKIPHRKGEYLCDGCGVPLARVKEE